MQFVVASLHYAGLGFALRLIDEGHEVVLAPVGTAIIGQREGDVVERLVPAGLKRLKVEEVIYQPERAGASD